MPLKLELFQLMRTVKILVFPVSGMILEKYYLNSTFFLFIIKARQPAASPWKYRRSMIEGRKIVESA
jgi:hypothetical protein